VLEIVAPLWTRIAGKEIAAQSEPTAFEEGTLTVSTECPTWGLQLGRMAEELRAQINCFLGCPVVKKVRVRCQGRPAHGKHGQARPDPSALGRGPSTDGWTGLAADRERDARAARAKQWH